MPIITSPWHLLSPFKSVLKLTLFLGYFHHSGNAFVVLNSNQNTQGVKIDNQHQDDYCPYTSIELVVAIKTVYIMRECIGGYQRQHRRDNGPRGEKFPAFFGRVSEIIQGTHNKKHQSAKGDKLNNRDKNQHHRFVNQFLFNDPNRQ